MASKLVVLCAALATFAHVSFASAEQAAPAKLPNVVILCTGGTIAGTGATTTHRRLYRRKDRLRHARRQRAGTEEGRERAWRAGLSDREREHYQR